MAPILETEGIVKRFDTLIANDGINFELGEGELHALLGENGSGKSTFLNVLYGMWKPDGGRIFVRGREAKIGSPREAIQRFRFGKLSQHADLVPTYSVAENVSFRRLPTRFGLFIDRTALREKVRQLLHLTGFELDPDAIVETLSFGQRQQVELLKVLANDPEVVFLDEVTAQLTPQEVDALFTLLRSFAAKGMSVVLVTHKLAEAMRCDRVTVLRKGRVTLCDAVGRVTPTDLLHAMFEQKVMERPAPQMQQAYKGMPILQVANVSGPFGPGTGAGRSILKNVSFEVNSGEILGIAGVAGNGQKALLDVLTGVTRPAAGLIRLAGQNIAGWSPHEIRRKNIVAYIPEDRRHVGSLPGLAVAENLILDEGRRPLFFPNRIRRSSTIRSFSRALVSEFQVQTPSIFARADSLSGGNLQKVILARELSIEADLIIAAQPTQGLDFKTTRFVHERLAEKRAEGRAVLLVSYDLDEIFALSDRIAVFYEGTLTEIPREHATLERIGRVMVAGNKEVGEAVVG